jgi:BASS family bile acid:Na+ symporter
MTTDRLLVILVTVTCIEMMVAVGLGVSLAELARVCRECRPVARALLANYVGVPTVAVGLLLLLHAHPMVAAGFLILASCPGAPFGPPITAIARETLAVSRNRLAPVLTEASTWTSDRRALRVSRFG